MKRITSLSLLIMVLIQFLGWIGCGCPRDVKPPLPPQVQVTSPVNICIGGSKVIGPAPVQGYTYLWYPSDGLSDPNVPNPIATPFTTTQYTLIVTDPKTGFSTQAFVDVIVTAPPTANAGLSQPVCLGDFVILGSPSVQGLSYAWSPASGLNATDVAQPQASPSTTTTYILTVTDNASGCSDISTTTIRVPYLDSIGFAPIPSPQLTLTPFTITVTAYDELSQVFSCYTPQALILDLTGSIYPTTGNFVNGLLSQSVSVCTTTATDQILVTTLDANISSTSFAVNPGLAGPFDSMVVESISSPLVAGSLFTITATARDACGNLIAGFNEGVILSDTTGTLSFTQATFAGGYLTVTAQVFKAFAGNVITINCQGKSAITNPFTIEAGGLDHFSSESIGTQQAGVAFIMTFTARDLYENFISSFAGPASITNTTATISPNSGNFSGGYLTQTVTVCKTTPLDAVTLSSGGRLGTSNSFSVSPGPASSIEIMQISSPQAAGMPFLFRARALDSCGDIATGFTSGATISDTTGTLSPGASSFIGGYLTETVSISSVFAGDVITVTAGLLSSTSNPFDIEVPSVNHFYVWAPSTVTAGQSFTIYIEAQDSGNNVLTGFAGTVEIFNSTFTIDPIISTSFSSGGIYQTVTVCGATASDTIEVQGAGTSGTSTVFSVSPGSLDSIYIDPVVSPQSQATPFTLTAYARDVCGNTATTHTGIAALSDSTGALTPSSGDFVSGIMSIMVATCSSSGGDSITVTSGGKTATSSTFTVIPGQGPLDHLIINTVTSPQLSGTPFSITVTAYNICNNVLTVYNQSASITDTTATISPSSGSFANGLLTQNEVICQLNINDVLIVTSGGKVTSSTGFDINSPANAGGDSFILTSGSTILGTPVLAGYTYFWTCNKSSCFLDDPCLAQPLASPLSTTTYTVAVSQAGCTNTSTATAFVNMYVTLTVPLDGEVDYPFNAIIMATLSEPLDLSTLNTDTFWLTDWTTGIPVSWTGTSVTYDTATQTAGLFHTNLTIGNTYQATLSWVILSIYGNSLVSDYSFGFDAGGSDITPPTILNTTPSTPAPLNALITATYSEYISPTSISGNTITVYTGASVVTGTIAYDIPSMTIIFTPSNLLISTTTYTAVARDAKDLAGNIQSSPYSWTFTTGTTLDLTAPTVAGVYPSPGASSVPSSVIVYVTFSEPMNPITINANTFYLLNPLGGRVAATITYTAATNTVYLTPSNFLNFFSTYTVAVTGGAGCTGVKDLAGNCMGATFTSTFTTGGAIFWDNMEAGGCSGSGIVLPCWTSSGGWAFLTQYYKSPTRSYGISLPPDGTYTLTSGDISIASGTYPSLTYWQRYKLFKSGPNRDRGFVKIQVVSGSCTDATLGTFRGVKQNFARQTYSLSNYAGCTIRIVFELDAQSGKGQWFIDDVLIQ